jgi:hypothetical protein
MGFAIAFAWFACTSSKNESEPSDDSSPTETGDDSDTSTKIDPATVPLTGECAMADDYGGFVVTADGKHGWVEGKVADGVVPVSVLEMIASDGDCQLLRRNNPFCDPGCAAGETCNFDGECVPYPSNKDLGTVTVTGLVDPVVMEPVFPGYTYYDTKLPTEPYASGALVTLSAPNSPGGPLELYGVGVSALEPTDASWVVQSGKPLTVRWSPPKGDVVRSEVALTISVDQHGATPSILRCSFEDDGEAVVSGKILEALVGAGVTGFPNGTLDRRTVDHGDVLKTGCADFTISSPRNVPVDVLGYTPCITSEDCPKGQTCDKDLQICE